MKEIKEETSSTKTKGKEQNESVVSVYLQTLKKITLCRKWGEATKEIEKNSFVQNGYVEQSGMDKATLTGPRDDRNNTKKDREAEKAEKQKLRTK